MPGASITIDTREVDHLLKSMIARLGHAAPAMKLVGEIVLESIQRNFEEHRSPEGAAWAPLDPDYAAWKTEKKGRNAEDILILSGMSGGLMGSIAMKAEADKVTIGTGPHIVYAAIHQFGGQAGRGRAATIPARPYMGVRDEDWLEIESAIHKYLVKR